MRRALGVILALGLPAAAAAQDFQVGARAKGMGGSYTAFGDDPVAIWNNPAGTAGQPTQLAITYQTFTQYEFDHVGMQISPTVVGDPEQGLLDPPIAPAYLGLVVQVGGHGLEMALSLAYIRPFQIKYVYGFDDPGLGTLLTQTDQQFSRIRAGYAVGGRLSDTSTWLPRASVGVALDYVYTTYKEVDQQPDPSAFTLVYEDSESALGYAAGLLATVYEGDTLMVDAGAAYNSQARFNFDLDQAVYPVWDWPALASAGLAVYLGEGYPLRVTFDAQWIAWKDAVGKPDVSKQGFNNTLSYSLGGEYRVPLGQERYTLFGRMGLRWFDTPWGSKYDLPSVGLSQLRIDTKGDRMLMLTLGVGFYWSRKNEAGETRLSGVDLATELFGDTGFLLGLSYTYQFD